MTVRQEILSFLQNPAAFAEAAADPDVWRAGLEDFAIPTLSQPNEYPLRVAQVDAWRGIAPLRAGLVLGPPGTGKTHLLAWMIVGYVHARKQLGLDTRVFVSAFTRNAIGNLLDAVATRAARYWPGNVDTYYFGAAPEAGLSRVIQHQERLDGNANAQRALQSLGASCVVAGGSIWSLYRLLDSRRGPAADGLTAQIFDLVCLDEASQMVLGHGLMSLGGLKPGGRIVVAGDDRQLPPIRAARDVAINDRQIGGSLYSFLKSAGVPEFPLDETFRLNAPLVNFPERKFYQGAYASAAPNSRLGLIENWEEGLTDWERTALDPAYPAVVFLHDGPPAATDNPFEARLAAHLTRLLAGRMRGAQDAQGALAPDFWRERVAVVSPHVAQNKAIRQRLAPHLQANAFVESVDRIQGKERDAIVLSYCVADAEFALAEGDFIFSAERLNVAITRARTKLIVLISRRLLDAAPTEQEVMDRAETLREFVFSGALKGRIELDGPDGRPINVSIRVVGFEGDEILADIVPQKRQRTGETFEMTEALARVLDAVRREVPLSKYPHAKETDVARRLARSGGVFSELRQLHALGWVSLRRPDGYNFWTVKDFPQQRFVYPATAEAVRDRLEEIIQSVRRGRFPPSYADVRDRFLWMNEDGDDILRPIINEVVAAGLARWDRFKNQDQVEWVGRQLQPDDNPPVAADEAAALSDEDFRVLNALEDIEANRINFGVVEAWSSAAMVARRLGWSRERVSRSLDRLAADGWIMIADEGRLRSRMAELAREVRYVKQRFARDDAARRPYLVRNLKLELRDRDKPGRSTPLRAFLQEQAAGLQAEWPAGAQSVLDLAAALERGWGGSAKIAAFQARALSALIPAWRGDGESAFVIAADTGSGKTEAACLPLIVGAAADIREGVEGVRAVLAYPRVRLAANQAQRLTGYLAALAAVAGAPRISIGMQSGQVPWRFGEGADDSDTGWTQLGGGGFSFPLFNCPTCTNELTIAPNEGHEGADKLSCRNCEWSFDNWIGSKQKLAERPPHLFLPTMDSLHQWLHDPRYGRLFGDDPGYAPPRAVLADEIHLYARLHGAQVGFALRRLMARAESNDHSRKPMLAIGMSATLGDPAAAWAKLIGRSEAQEIRPTVAEREPNPKGREYFYFIQPEIESRGQDVAGASTAIQSLMCLGHGMRRRTGQQGGFRAIAFLDSIDKIRRLHADYEDAEGVQGLAAYRTRLYSDDPATGAVRTTCCQSPHGCDRFRDGECWFFAATDARQVGPHGLRAPGQRLEVASQPVTSATTGRIEAMIKSSDVVFATSSLEVGYDDPDITLVFQHYAPVNLASFVQRKGRGGRGADDRPLTGVTLSLYSPRDSRWFRTPSQMVSPENFDVPLNAENYFVRRGQMVTTILDALARRHRRGGNLWREDGTPEADALSEATALLESVFGSAPWADYPNCPSLEAFLASANLALGAPGASLPEIRSRSTWAPNFLSDQGEASIDIVVRQPAGAERTSRENVALVFAAAAPGNASRRFDATDVYWRPPVDGRGPWLDQADYDAGRRLRPFGDNANELLALLPSSVRQQIPDMSASIFIPRRITLEALGRAFGASFAPAWAAVLNPPSVARAPNAAPGLRVEDSARGFLSGFPVVRTMADRARAHDVASISAYVDGLDAFLGDGLGGNTTGLTLAQLYWGGQSEAPLKDRRAGPVSFRQIFIDPESNKPALHGRHAQVEGVQFKLKGSRIDQIIEAEMAGLASDPSAKRTRQAQMLRYRFESGAVALGGSAFLAQRAALLIASAVTAEDLRRDMARLIRFWSPAALGNWFEAARARFLHQHPLLTQTRVAALGPTFGEDVYKPLFQDILTSLADEGDLRTHLRSTLLHGLGLRLRQSFVDLGSGDERQIALHIRLPSQFEGIDDNTITVCETVGLGDGTTRAFLRRLDEAQQHWTNGFLHTCPNADEDRALEACFAQPSQHETWRAANPNDLATLSSIAREVGADPERPLPAILRRVLFDREAIGDHILDVYDLAVAVRRVGHGLNGRLGRQASAWELATAAIDSAHDQSEPVLASALNAYAALEDAETQESFSPEARLADQVYRVSARLCQDGCQACLHNGSDLMSDSLTEASTSRSLIERFVCT